MVDFDRIYSSRSSDLKIYNSEMWVKHSANLNHSAESTKNRMETWVT